MRLGPQHTGLDGRIIIEELLRFLEGNGLEDYQAKQVVAGLNSSRRAQLALRLQLIDITLVCLQQRVTLGSLGLPGRTAIKNAQRTDPHVFRSARVHSVQTKISVTNPSRPIPRMQVDGVAMLINGRVRGRNGLCGFERIDLEDEDSAYGRG